MFVFSSLIAGMWTKKKQTAFSYISHAAKTVHSGLVCGQQAITTKKKNSMLITKLSFNLHTFSSSNFFSCSGQILYRKTQSKKLNDIYASRQCVSWLLLTSHTGKKPCFSCIFDQHFTVLILSQPQFILFVLTVKRIYCRYILMVLRFMWNMVHMKCTHVHEQNVD